MDIEPPSSIWLTSHNTQPGDPSSGGFLFVYLCLFPHEVTFRPDAYLKDVLTRGFHFSKILLVKGWGTIFMRPNKRAALTKREQQIAQLIVQGLGNRQIAKKIGNTVGTVKFQVHCILTKQGVSRREHLTINKPTH
jgi:DNA-binding CsgD family transcriptional regulator